jgi:hypothetical protein
MIGWSVWSSGSGFESAKLWNLTPSDLAEIQRSLKELTE